MSEETTVDRDLSRFGRDREIALDRVTQELRTLWKKASNADAGTEAPPVSRVATVNLVVYARDRAEAERATTHAVELSARHPGRILLIEPGETDRIGATITAHCHLGAGNRQICSEQVTLRAGGRALEQIVYSVAPLLISDLPTVLWFPGHPGALSVPDDLLALASRILFDSHGCPEKYETLDQIVAWLDNPRAGAVSDLAWHRLERWRALTAQTFDEKESLIDLHQLDRIEVDYLRGEEGSPGGRVEALYFVFWVASRLGMRPAPDGRGRDGEGGRERNAWNLVDPSGRAVELRVRAHERRGSAPGDLIRVCLGAAGGEIRYEIERHSERETAEIRVHVPRSCPVPMHVGLASPDLVELLARSLESAAEDSVYAETVRLAQSILSSG